MSFTAPEGTTTVRDSKRRVALIAGVTDQEYADNADAIGVLRLLEASRILGREWETRFYQASTSELYGLVQEIPQEETTAFYPRSRYAVAKLYGYWVTVNYREACGMFASNSILFNHESPIRGETVLTRKFTRGVARVEAGLEETLYLGNLEAKRGWGYARDYVEGMHPILQADAPDDYVLASGEARSVREFAELAFAEVDLLIGDSSRATAKLGWKLKARCAQLVKEMVAGDFSEARLEVAMASTPYELKGKTAFAAGHRGVVGGPLARRLSQEDVEILTAGRAELDLGDEAQVFDWFAKKKPQALFRAAAKVSGIVVNNTLRAEFIYDNLAIAAHVIHAAYLNRTEKLMFLGSSCIYPKLAPQPLREDYMLTGPLEITNEPYAITKIAAIKMVEAYRSQYGCDSISVMPTNLYGPNDNYHPEYSYVFPALIRRLHEAKLAGAPNVVVWGTGTLQREFFYVDDMADACVHLIKMHSSSDIVNIGTGENISIGGVRQSCRAHHRAYRRDRPRHLAARRASSSTSAVSAHSAGTLAPRWKMALCSPTAPISTRARRRRSDRRASPGDRCFATILQRR